MTKTKPLTDSDPEIAAIALVYEALKNLEAGAQARVLRYVAGKLGIPAPATERTRIASDDFDQRTDLSTDVSGRSRDYQETDDSDGISPVALKWMKRSGITTTNLSKLFSIGGDEIDLIAETVPGKNKKERMHSVLLLKSIAAYLSTGAARVSHEQIKEACLHYDAFDTANFATHLKSFAAEVNGTKESGYSLTARGLTKATETIKSILLPKE